MSIRYFISPDYISPSGIEEVHSFDKKNSDVEYYNLIGQRVQYIKKGVYIHKGKKIFIQ